MNAKLAPSLVASLFLLSLSLSIPAQAERVGMGQETAPVRVVGFGDLDLSTASGVRTLYSRLTNAAWKVCHDIIPATNGPSGIENGKCRRTLIDAGVADVNRLALTALHTKKGAEVTARR
jgi:UrcA family protein